MCGIIAYIAHKASERGPDLTRLRDLFTVNEEARGGDAFGFAWIDAHGVLRVFKQIGPIFDFLPMLTMVRGCRMFVGHVRRASRGHWAELSNAHPFPVNGGWYVHNGTIKEHNQLARDFALFPTTNCDSEILGLLAERNGGTNADRMLAAVMTTEEAPLAVAALWNHPRRLVVIRRDQPLHFGISRGDCYLASLPDGLPRRVCAVNDRTMIDFHSKGVTNVDF
jgi:glucosamine 6-phosphate synthetase-like amidotransferase/phosphosugar isomerase protein